MVEVHHSSGNIYADLGLPNAVEMQAKARTVHQIAAAIDRRGLSHAEVAILTGMPESHISAVLKGRFRDITESNLRRYLAAISRRQDD